MERNVNTHNSNVEENRERTNIARESDSNHFEPLTVPFFGSSILEDVRTSYLGMGQITRPINNGGGANQFTSLSVLDRSADSRLATTGSTEEADRSSDSVQRNLADVSVINDNDSDTLRNNDDALSDTSSITSDFSV